MALWQSQNPEGQFAIIAGRKRRGIPHELPINKNCSVERQIRDTDVTMGSSDGAANSLPQIIENYRDFAPPRQVRPLIEDLLSTVPPHYLVGLKTVLLTNRNALTRDQRRQKVSGRKGKYSLAEARGAYYRPTRSSPAYVLLLIDNILSPWPSWILRVPYFRYMTLAEVLYHEIGHHIHALHQPVHDGKENVAEDWQRKLNRVFHRKRFWYLRPLIYPAGKIVRFILKSATYKKLEKKYEQPRA
jgi:hypothetical protein